jgi:hypothetical protein|tara:strand:+ start:14110 stop:14325 length:216 start_codon:yes stop_codon:yes gene_type:complete
MQPEIQITVFTSRAERIFDLIKGTALELEVFQNGRDTIIDIYYTLGFFETEVDEIVEALDAANYDYDVNDI